MFRPFRNAQRRVACPGRGRPRAPKPSPRLRRPTDSGPSRSSARACLATVVAPRGERVLDGSAGSCTTAGTVISSLPLTVRPGEEIQLLCRDALDIGDQARTLTADGSMTLDLGRIHRLTGPVHVEGAEPGGGGGGGGGGCQASMRGRG